jgi:hypothetical protein
MVRCIKVAWASMAGRKDGGWPTPSSGFLFSLAYRLLSMISKTLSASLGVGQRPMHGSLPACELCVQYRAIFRVDVGLDRLDSCTLHQSCCAGSPACRCHRSLVPGIAMDFWRSMRGSWMCSTLKTLKRARALRSDSRRKPSSFRFKVNSPPQGWPGAQLLHQ